MKKESWIETQHNIIGLGTGFPSKKFRGIDSVIPFRGIPSFTEKSILKLGTERNYAKKFVWQNSVKIHLFWHYLWNFRLPRFEKVIQNDSFLFQKTELWACFRPRNALEIFFESLLLFLFHGTEFRIFSLPRNASEWNFGEFSVQRNSWNSVGTNHLFVYSIYWGIICLSEISNPNIHCKCWFYKIQICGTG